LTECGQSWPVPPDLDAGSLDAVLLDAGGVLLLPSAASMRRLLGTLGAEPDEEACVRAHYVCMREIDRLGTVDWPAADRVLAREAGVPEERLDESVPLLDQIYLREPWTPVPGAAEALLALQAGGYALAVVSNAEGTMEAQLADHRICRVGGGEAAHVAVVVDSHVVGIEKPDPRIFDIALDALGVDRSRCLYVGDTVFFDVDGARAAGIAPVHVDPYRLCPLDDHPHVASIVDVADALCNGGRAR
jgi:putative hydrolase of the HAD superfamily